MQGFLKDHAAEGAAVCTDDTAAYESHPFDHEAVRYSVAELVCGQAHTNGIESFCAVLKRAHKGVFHKIGPKHLNRHVTEFAGKHNGSQIMGCRPALGRRPSEASAICRLDCGLVPTS